MSILQSNACDASRNTIDVLPNLLKLPVTYTEILGGDTLSKTYTRNGDDIVKTPAAEMWRGEAMRKALPFRQCADEMLSATSRTAFCYGTYASNLPAKVRIVTVKSGLRDPDNGIITRTQKDLAYQNAPGVLMIDHDPSEYGKSFTVDEFLEMLFVLCPTMARSARFVKGSVSAGIHLTGKKPKHGKGFHVYFPVLNASDIPRFGKTLFDMFWLHGCGFIALSRSGSMLVRTCIDGVVFNGERLDFVGQPVIKGEGLELTPPDAIYVEGDYLDTKNLTDLSPNEVAEVERLIMQAKEAVKPVSKKKAKIWADDQVLKRVAKGVSESKAKKDVKALTMGDFVNLDGDFEVEFLNLGKTTVTEILLDPEKYDGQALADPIEGAEYGTSTAMFWWNDGVPIIHSHAHGKIVYFLPVADDWVSRYNSNAANFNIDHAMVILGGKAKVMRRESEGSTFDGRGEYVFIDPKQLSLAYSNTKIKVSEKKFLNVFDAWLYHPDSVAYTGGVVFLPGKTAPNSYRNIWEGFVVQPIENEAALEHIYFHIREVVCAGNPVLSEYLLNWIAYTFQYPERQAGSAIVCRGDKGSGKSTLANFLRLIWGRHALHISNSTHLTGNFNAHLSDVCLLVIDEAFFFADTKHESILKALITEPVLMIERKGIDAVQQPSCIKAFLTTNAEACVPATRNERRYFVTDVADTYIGNRDYFNTLNQETHCPEVQSAFLYAMLNRCIDGWHSGDIPDSSGLRAQRYHSLGSIQKWLVDGLIAGGFNGCGGWEAEMGSSDLFASYNAWGDVARISEHKRANLCTFSSYLGKLYTKTSHAGGRGRRGFYLGDLVDAVMKFESYERINLDELSN